MKTRLIISMLVFVFLVGVSAAATSPNDVLKLWKQNYGNIDSVPLEISYTNRLVEASSTVYPDYAEKMPYLIKSYRIQEGDKFFVNLITQRNPSEEPLISKYSYDGISERLYRPSQKRGDIFSGRSKSGLDENYVKNYLLAYSPEVPTIEMMFSKPEQDPNYVLSACEPTTINGVVCEGFELFRVGETAPRKELWVAPDKGMLPMLYRSFNYARGDRYVVTEVKVLEIAQENGLWYPKKGRVTINQGSGMEKYTYETVVDKFVINPEIDPNVFKLEFPPGTTVVDDRIKESYEVGLD